MQQAEKHHIFMPVALTHMSVTLTDTRVVKYDSKKKLQDGHGSSVKQCDKALSIFSSKAFNNHN